VLASFSEKLSAAAQKRLAQLGVEVLLGKGVEHVDKYGIIVGGERIPSKTVIWTAGVAPSPAGKWLGAPTDRSGRVRVQSDLTAPGYPNIFVIGDSAALQQDGKPLPGVAQVAIQQGRYAGKLIRRRIDGSAAPPPFRYFDKGNMAVVGKGFAVLQSGPVCLSGFLVWLVWAGVHLQFLALSRVRLSVLAQWVWTFLTGQRGSRLIVNHHEWHGTGPASPVETASDTTSSRVAELTVAK
jgi:NADH dehydrogenase FAD-containing subunit